MCLLGVDSSYVYPQSLARCSPCIRPRSWMHEWAIKMQAPGPPQPSPLGLPEESFKLSGPWWHLWVLPAWRSQKMRLTEALTTVTGRTGTRRLSFPLHHQAPYTSSLLNNSLPKCHCHFVIPKAGGLLATKHKLLGSGLVPQKKTLPISSRVQKMQIQLPQLEQTSFNRVSVLSFGRNHLEVLGSESSISSTSKSKKK